MSQFNFSNPPKPEQPAERVEVEQHIQAYTTAWKSNDNTSFRVEAQWLWKQGISTEDLDYNKDSRTYSLPYNWKAWAGE